jgi:8-oxo-dGTP pyrophosphatase MutT (NUDIX family)
LAAIVNKVLAYITRGDELLVFRHRDFPEAGLQVPGGTVEEGELPHDAVLREVYEESGLQEVRIVRLLGRYFHNAAAYRDETHQRHVYGDEIHYRNVYHLETTGPVASAWLHYESHRSDGGQPLAFSFFWMKLDDPELSLAGRRGDLLSKLV